MERRNETRYLLLYLLAILFFALGGAAVRYCQTPPCNTALYRLLFSLPLLYPAVRKELRQMRRRDAALLLAGGVLFGINLWLWNYSLLATTQANANLLANLHIFAVAPLSCLIFRERLNRYFLLAILVTVAGMALLLLGKADPQASFFLGDLAAFSTSIVYGGYLLVVYHVRDRVSALCTLFMASLGALPLLLPASLLTEGLFTDFTWSAVWPLLVLVLVGHIGGIGLVNYCLGKLRASMASLLSLTQPAVAALLGLALFSERLTWIEILGVAVVSGGVLLAQKKEAPPVAEAAPAG